MRIIEDDIWLCVDCTQVSCNGVSGMEIEGTLRAEEVQKGLAELGQHLVPDFDSNTGDGLREFSRINCESCGEWRGGYRARFAKLGPDEEAIS